MNSIDQISKFLPQTRQVIELASFLQQRNPDLQKLSGCLNNITDAGVLTKLAVAEFLLKHGRCKDAEKIICSMAKADLEPEALIRCAIVDAELGKLEQCKRLVESAYAGDPSLTDGYARIGWIIALRNQCAYEKTIPYFEKDLKAGRLRGKWKLYYAKALAILDAEGEALNHIREVYYEDAFIMNGYAQYAWMKYCVLDYRPIKALKYFLKDQEQGRLDGECKVKLAIIYASLGRLKDALKIVGDLYNNNVALRDAYSLIAWAIYVFNDDNLVQAISCIRKDENIGRSNGLNKLYLAAIKMKSGSRLEAESLIEKLYEDMPNYNIAGYSMLAALDYAKNLDLTYSLDLLNKDYELGKQGCIHKLIHSLLLHANQNFSIASKLYREAFEETSLVDRLAKSWLLRLGYENELINSMMSVNFVRDETSI
jgi:hypothetical protein